MNMQIELQAASVAAILAGLGGGVLWLRRIILKEQNGNGQRSRQALSAGIDELRLAAVRNEERVSRLLSTVEQLLQAVENNSHSVADLTVAVKRLCDHIAKER